MEHLLWWGLVYLAFGVVVAAIFARRSEPWDRLKQLLRMIVNWRRREDRVDRDDHA